MRGSNPSWARTAQTGLSGLAKQDILRVPSGESEGEPPPSGGAICRTTLEPVNQTRRLREFASTMFLLAILRFLLDLVSGNGAVGPRARTFGKAMAECRRSRVARRSALPHEWMSMAYVLTEVSRGFCGRDPGDLGGTNHPLHFVFRAARRWAGCAELCPAPVVRVAIDEGQSRRA